MDNVAASRRNRRGLTVGIVLRTALALAMLAGAVVGSGLISRDAEVRADSPPIWNQAGQCINEDTGLPHTPRQKGDQFVVYAPTEALGTADLIAGAIRSHHVIGVYEKGLHISSILQPGQPGPFHIFVDPTPNLPFNGETGHVCNSTWVAVIIRGDIGNDVLTIGAAYHELFHAAQFALIRGTHSGGAWWFEATAEAAEVWFGSTEPRRFDSALIQHSTQPMNTWVSGCKSYLGNCHQYGAYHFVQSVLGSSGLPSAADWAFLRDSFLAAKTDSGSEAATGVASAIAAHFPGQTMGTEVARFWADETNPKPKYAATASSSVDLVTTTGEVYNISAPKYLAADLESLAPMNDVRQLDVVVPKVPAGVEVWINYSDGPGGNGVFERLQPGDNFNETFCRLGYTPGTFSWPKVNAVRIAVTTVKENATATVKIKALASASRCPKQLLIVPGISIGQLHLGMSKSEANAAASLLGKCITTNYPGFGNVDGCGYSEGYEAPVFADFYKGRLAYLAITADWRFITTTGIQTWQLTSLQTLGPGSTMSQFEQSAPGVQCPGIGSKDKLCSYQRPITRYTFAGVGLEQACPPDPQPCGLAQPGQWIVDVLGVATKTFFQAYECVLSKFQVCPGGVP